MITVFPQLVSGEFFLQFQKFKHLNSFPILCTEFVKKWGNYSRGDIIQGRILIKEIQYVFTCSFLIFGESIFLASLQIISLKMTVL